MIEDKLELFARIIFEKVEKQSNDLLTEINKGIKDDFTAKELRIEQTVQEIISDFSKKSDIKNIQILSRANIEAKHKILKKKEEILRQVITTLCKKAYEYSKSSQYLEYLNNCINYCINSMDGFTHLQFYFTNEDILNYGDHIKKTIANCNKDVIVEIHPAEIEIIGGCICRDVKHIQQTICTIKAMLDDNRGLIGKTVMDYLE